jgi:hypothetical protein
MFTGLETWMYDEKLELNGKFPWVNLTHSTGVIEFSPPPRFGHALGTCCNGDVVLFGGYVYSCSVCVGVCV